MRSPDVAIVGGGLLGRLLAWRAALAGLRVSLYDAGSPLGEQSAAWAAAGMITPSAEAVDADAEIVAMGRHSVSLWPEWLEELPCPVYYRDSGTMLVWHREDIGEARRFEKMLRTRDPHAELLPVDGVQISELEPSLGTRFPQGFLMAGEAQIDNRGLLKAVALALENLPVECHWNTQICPENWPTAGIVVDCRGMGAKQEWRDLRGVRGEIARLHAPEVRMDHMVRLLHPRYSVYVAPRPDGMLVLGATSIESDDRTAISVRGALELLSSAYSLFPSLAEARILEFATQVRPALTDNRPAIRYEASERTFHVNGLYRHGFLLSPTVVEEVLSLLFAVPGEVHTSRWACLRGSPLAGLEYEAFQEERQVAACLSL